MSGVYLPLPQPRQSLLIFLDSIFLVLALGLAVAIRFLGDPRVLEAHGHVWIRILVTTLLVQACLYYGELYDVHAQHWNVEFFRQLLNALAASVLLLSLLYYTFESLRFGRGILFLYLPLALAAILLSRLFHRWLAGKEALTENVLIVGTGVSAQQVALSILEAKPIGWQVVGFLGEHPAEVGRKLVNPSVIGTVSELLAAVKEHRVNRIVVALEDRRGKLPVRELLACKMAGIAVEESTLFSERFSGKILVTNLRPSWLVFSEGFSKPRLVRSSKRAVEFLIAFILLVLTAPLFALVALLVRLESRGPVFYRQERVGEHGVNFNLIKFRTMRADAEAATGPVWAPGDGDSRITRIGLMLRKARLDELPQLWNVVRGEMSFVGPRPERPHFVEQLSKLIPYYDERHTVKPGITGWAQVRFHYASSIEDAEEKLQYDLYYIKHMSLVLDLLIALRTAKVVLFGKGAR